MYMSNLRTGLGVGALCAFKVKIVFLNFIAIYVDSLRSRFNVILFSVGAFIFCVCVFVELPGI